MYQCCDQCSTCEAGTILITVQRVRGQRSSPVNVFPPQRLYASKPGLDDDPFHRPPRGSYSLPQALAPPQQASVGERACKPYSSGVCSSGETSSVCERRGCVELLVRNVYLGFRQLLGSDVCYLHHVHRLPSWFVQRRPRHAAAAAGEWNFRGSWLGNSGHLNANFCVCYAWSVAVRKIMDAMRTACAKSGT